MTVVYAVGDIHGNAIALTNLRNAIIDYSTSNNDMLSEQHIVVYLGDYIDRGPDSKQVLDILMNEPMEIHEVFLRGNHEEMMLDAISGKNEELFLYNGGIQTVQSFGFEPLGSLWQYREYITNNGYDNFVKNMKFSYELGNYFFCHAGVDFSKPLNEQNNNVLIWVRDVFLKSQAKHEKVIVHGHTPTPYDPQGTVDPKPVVTPNRINVDTGGFFSDIYCCAIIDVDKGLKGFIMYNHETGETNIEDYNEI